ncbi:MAG: hypothetical protein NTY20_04870 [Candidatus Aenigmarchaeota archaeon]|nr:hypothetical protein [Candidatus Aenigmarchaeota archaeon]
MPKEFQYSERRKSPEFTGYLSGLSRENNLFDCPYLRVLPEDVTIQRHQREGPPKRFKKRDLMCTKKADYSSDRCGGLDRPRLNEDGNLELYCDWPLEGWVILKLERE